MYDSSISIMSHTRKIQIQLLFNRFPEFSENVDAISLFTTPTQVFLRTICDDEVVDRQSSQGKCGTQGWKVAYENSLRAHTI